MMFHMRLFLGNDYLGLDFPYDAAQVADIKKINGAKFDRVTKIWKVPISSLEEARGFAAANRFNIDNVVI